MSNSSVNIAFAKSFIVFMAIVILVQGAVYLGLSIWGLMQESCSAVSTDIEGQPFNFVMHLIYFQREECGDPSLTLPQLQDPIQITMGDWSKSFTVTYRMNAFLLAYAVVSAIWILTSLIVLSSVCGAVTKNVVAYCYWPWFLIVIGGSILDAVATGFHIYDIIETTSATDALQYIGADTSNQAIMTFFQNFDAYFITPAVVLTCISSRVVLIWLLNIFGTSFCLSLARVLMRNNASKVRHQTVSQASTLETNQVYAAEVTTSAYPKQQTQRQYEEQQQQQQPQHTQIKPKPLPIQAAAITPTHNQSDSASERAIFAYPAASINSPDPQYANASRRQPTGDGPTYRNTDTHPDRLNYPPTQAPAATATETAAVIVAANAPPAASPEPKLMYAATQELSPISPLNTRYSVAENPYPMQNQPQRVSAELRSQLPWSYTGPQQMSRQPPPQPPPKPQLQAYPEIPEPDYTLHPGKRDRPMTSVNAELTAQFQQKQLQQQSPQQHHEYSRW